MTYCPHCGRKTFESAAATGMALGLARSGFDDVVAFSGTLLVSTAGYYGLLWQSGLDHYWLAPAAGLSTAVGLAVLREVRRKPSPQRPAAKSKTVKIDVQDRSSRSSRQQQWFLDAFRGCRPGQLYRFADAAVNQGVPITRRPMMAVGVSQGQFEIIRSRLIEPGWVDLDRRPNAAAVLNWRGRAVLRGVLADCRPTPSAILAGRGWLDRQPPHHRPTTDSLMGAV